MYTGLLGGGIEIITLEPKDMRIVLHHNTVEKNHEAARLKKNKRRRQTVRPIHVTHSHKMNKHFFV